MLFTFNKKNKKRPTNVVKNYIHFSFIRKWPIVLLDKTVPQLGSCRAVWNIFGLQNVGFNWSLLCGKKIL